MDERRKRTDRIREQTRAESQPEGSEDCDECADRDQFRQQRQRLFVDLRSGLQDGNCRSHDRRNDDRGQREHGANDAGFTQQRIKLRHAAMLVAAR